MQLYKKFRRLDGYITNLNMSSPLSHTNKPISRGQFALVAGLLIIIIILARIVAVHNSSETANSAKPDPYQLARDTTYEAIAAKKAQEEERLTSTISVKKGDVAQLSKLASFRKDDFDGVTWIKPKSRPSYENGLYCYFSQQGEQASNFRFFIQYYADDWLFIKSYRFIVDGVTYDYVPNKVDRDNGSGSIWEWSDKHVGVEDMPLIKALAYAKTAKVRFEGSQYYKDRIITAAQLKTIRNMLELYTGMGGVL